MSQPLDMSDDWTAIGHEPHESPPPKPRKPRKPKAAPAPSAEAPAHLAPLPSAEALSSQRDAFMASLLSATATATAAASAAVAAAFLSPPQPEPPPERPCPAWAKGTVWEALGKGHWGPEHESRRRRRKG